MSPRDDDSPPDVLGAAIDPAEFPALEGFFLGYLHEDLEVAYGSPEAAMDGFIADAGPEDHYLVSRDWHELATRIEALDESHRLDVLGRLGLSWQPGSWDEVVGLFGRLRRALEEGEW